MTDDFKKSEKQKEIDDFFAQFDRISDSLYKAGNDKETNTNIKITTDREPRESAHDATPQYKRKTRMERLSEQKPPHNDNLGLLDVIRNKLSAVATKTTDFLKNKFLIYNEDTYCGDDDTTSAGVTMSTKGKRRKHKKYKLNVKQLMKFLGCIALVFCVLLGGLVVSIVVTAPKINPDKIYDLLTESSVLYDDQENIVDSVFGGDGNRTNVSYADLPPQLVEAFVAIEDKTFNEHNGFNIIRIFGAIKESFSNGGNISGTSTITQQLARNLYLADTKSVYSIKRKIAEAYYTVLLERALTKEEIIEAYLNTIYLGYESYGVQAAAQAYFSKDVGDLDLTECAALAALPKAPHAYALVKRYESATADPDDENIIFRGDDFTYVFNDVSKDRRNLTLKFMCEQGYISEAERDAALAENFKDHINPSMESMTEISSYFADYVIKDVISDLMDEHGIDYATATEWVNTSGLRIYTTMDSKAQKIAEKEFSNNANFPSIIHLDRDGSRNILSQSGNIMLYNKDAFFKEDGSFVLSPDEYRSGADGDLILLKNKRLNFYKVEANGISDINVEFKDLYTMDGNVLFSNNGGVIAIPPEYKSLDADRNMVISAKFFEDKPNFFVFANGGISIDKDHYALRQMVVQPQSSMVIVDQKTGGIKALVGGRNTVGRKLFSRATSPRPPGSSIKPISVYGPALQSGADAAKSGTPQTFETYDNYGNKVPNLYGDYWTAASVIDDAPLMVNGKLWPKNAYGYNRGLSSLRESVQQSINVNAVKIVQQLGVSNSVKFAKKLGVTTLVESGGTNDMNAAAMALGGMTQGISPLEMAGAYSAYANGGTYIEPISYTKVTNKRGEILLENSPYTAKVMDPGVAFIMSDILQSAVQYGTGKNAAFGSQPVAGKTGTTTDNYDAWFVGFTPQYTASLWIGNDINMELSNGSPAAARLWSKIMKQICAGIPTGSFGSPPSDVISVTIDNKSGMLPSDISAFDDRSTVRSEYFIKGTEPTKHDTVHTYVDICPESGALFTPYCYSHAKKFGVKRPYMPASGVSDIAYEVPHYYCNLHNLDTAKYPIAPGAAVNDAYQWDGTLRDPNEPDESTPPEDGTTPTVPGDSVVDSNDGDNADNEDTSGMPSWLN